MKELFAKDLWHSRDAPWPTENLTITNHPVLYYNINSVGSIAAAVLLIHVWSDLIP